MNECVHDFGLRGVLVEPVRSESRRAHMGPSQRAVCEVMCAK
jgi:hypothetical protein